jgi:hypothetical protein
MVNWSIVCLRLSLDAMVGRRVVGLVVSVGVGLPAVLVRLITVVAMVVAPVVVVVAVVVSAVSGVVILLRGQVVTSIAVEIDFKIVSHSGGLQVTRQESSVQLGEELRNSR